MLRRSERHSRAVRDTSNVDVLVVDDDPGVRQLVSATLMDEGLTVATAKNGREALELVEERHPQAVVVDLEMPVMDGRALIREIRQREINTAVIILSAHGARHAGRELNVRRTLEKPFDPQDLVDHVRRVVS